MLVKALKVSIFISFLVQFGFSQDPIIYGEDNDWFDGCTVITVGKKASSDGSVMNSHTCDSHRTRSTIFIEEAKDFTAGEKVVLYKRFPNDSLAMPTYKYVKTGTIPQVSHTYSFLNTAYPCMNETQLAIGESTFGGRKTLHSEKGLIDCQQLVRLMVERCATARDAIKMAGELTKKYGWNDEGECLTITDTKELWHFEIVGPGKGNLGAVWAAQRVPDNHVSVNANASRISKIDLDNSDYFMASENIFKVAQDSGWWNPEDGEFEFCYAYDPTGRQTFASRRREWRVLSLAAPSLNLHANTEQYPFSVKPDSLFTLAKMVSIFQDYFEHTPYNMIKNQTWINEDGHTEISPVANPFMHYDMNKMLRVNGGWDELGERTIARWYTMYATITQSRDWLPNEIGGLVWYALDNVATSIYVPFYCSITDTPKPYKVPGRDNGYTRESGWWAFNRMGTIAGHRWGEMRHDVAKVWGPMQKELFANQQKTEQKALKLIKENPEMAKKFLTEYGKKWGNKVVDEAWKLGDFFWTKYDEKF